MVQVTTSTRARYPSAGYSTNSSSQGTPQGPFKPNCPGKVHVHFVHGSWLNAIDEYRDVFGNGIAIRSYGEIMEQSLPLFRQKIAAGEFVWAYELKMQTLQVLNLTPEVSPPQADGYAVENQSDATTSSVLERSGAKANMTTTLQSTSGIWIKNGESTFLRRKTSKDLELHLLMEASGWTSSLWASSIPVSAG